MVRHLTLSLLLSLATILTSPLLAQQSDSQDKSFDVRSSIGDLHVGKDADARSAGLPLYPGARPKHEGNNDPLNFGILTESFGLKLIVAKYESDDPPAKIIAYYRDKLKKYGKVLECDSPNDNTGFQVDDEKQGPKPLTCDGDNKGPVRELKVGTEDNAHLVAIEPRDTGKGSTFAIVYMQKRGKSGDI
ncbi:MAG TPA: hypothetical protein VIW68_13885 [Candidatus Sulfotelmatobacter sp.]